jgi:hypothetical protein
MSTTLGHKVVNGAVALSLVFGLAACGESPADLQRKPDLIDLLSQRAVATCSLQRSEMDHKPYDARLRDVLARASASTLQYYKKNDITVCLDKRLSAQHNGFWSGDAHGVYYPGQKILTLWDNGRDRATAGWTERTAADYGARFLKEFSGAFGGWTSSYESLEDVAGPMLAFRSGGKATSYRWRAGEGYSVLDNNPGLKSPPVLPAQPAPVETLRL